MSKKRSHSTYAKSSDKFNYEFDKFWNSLSDEEKNYANNNICKYFNLIRILKI